MDVLESLRLARAGDPLEVFLAPVNSRTKKALEVINNNPAIVFDSDRGADKFGLDTALAIGKWYYQCDRNVVFELPERLDVEEIADGIESVRNLSRFDFLRYLKALRGVCQESCL